MFRLRVHPLGLILASLSLALSGCHRMIYREMYSPRKNYYVAPPDKREVATDKLLETPKPPVEAAPMMPPPMAPAALPPPALPGADPAAPPAMVPGL